MRPPSCVRVGLPSVFLVLSAASAGFGQSAPRSYVGAAVGGALLDADIATGASPSAGLVFGARVAPRWDVEGEVMFPRRGFTRAYGGGPDDTPSGLIYPPGTPPEQRDLFGIWTRFNNARDVHMTVSGVAIFRATFERVPRLSLGLLAGLSVHRVTDTRIRTVVRVGPAVPADHPARRDQSEIWPRTLGGPTVGAQLSVALTPHLSVTPDLRLHYGSLADEINNIVQPSVRMTWRF